MDTTVLIVVIILLIVLGIFIGTQMGSGGTGRASYTSTPRYSGGGGCGR